NVLSTTDPRGVITSYGYDVLNRQTTLIEAWQVPLQQRTTTTGYDAVGNVKRVSRPQEADLDKDGNPVSNPLHILTSIGYDKLARPTTVIEAWAVNAQQRTTTTAYDAVGNVLSISKPQDYDLDPNGNLITNPYHILTTFGYDTLNRQTTLI